MIKLIIIMILYDLKNTLIIKLHSDSTHIIKYAIKRLLLIQIDLRMRIFLYSELHIWKAIIIIGYIQCFSRKHIKESDFSISNTYINDNKDIYLYLFGHKEFLNHIQCFKSI